MRKSIGILALGLLLLPAMALAEPKISLEAKAEKEVVVKDDKGREKVQRVPASDIGPGETIIYTIDYKNAGDEPATNVVVDNPIAAETSFVPGSATGEGAQIVFSIDGGKTYNKPPQLTYEVPGLDGKPEKVVATPDEYTHIRWIIEQVPPGTAGSVSFKVKVR